MFTFDVGPFENSKVRSRPYTYTTRVSKTAAGLISPYVSVSLPFLVI